MYERFLLGAILCMLYIWDGFLKFCTNDLHFVDSKTFMHKVILKIKDLPTTFSGLSSKTFDNTLLR